MNLDSEKTGWGDIFTRLKTINDQIVDLYASLDDKRRRQVGPDGDWSPAQHMDHLAKVITGTYRVLRFIKSRRGRDPRIELISEDAPEGYGRPDFSRWPPERKVQSPEEMLPTDNPDPDAVLVDFALAESKIADFIERHSWSEIAGFTVEHPLLDRLDGMGWLEFLAEHNRRHLEQIRRLLET